MHSKSVQFLSTPSARRATATAGIGSTGGYNFYPRPPRGGRPGFVLLDMIACYFYPRPPRGGRPVFPNAELYLLLFLSTPSARRATPFDACMPWSGMISIHALREEGDLYIPYYNAAGEISIHALREEGDTLTVSARIPSTYFYPRPPRGGRREKTGEFIEDKEFLSTPSARRATACS